MNSMSFVLKLCSVLIVALFVVGVGSDDETFLNIKVFKSKGQCTTSKHPFFIVSIDETVECSMLWMNFSEGRNPYSGFISTESVEGPCINRVKFRECPDKSCTNGCTGNVFYWNTCEKSKIFGNVKFSYDSKQITSGLGLDIVRLDYYWNSDCDSLPGSPTYSVQFGANLNDWCPLESETTRIQNKCTRVRGDLVFVTSCFTIFKWYQQWWGILSIVFASMTIIPLLLFLMCLCLILFTRRKQLLACCQDVTRIKDIEKLKSKKICWILFFLCGTKHSQEK